MILGKPVLTHVVWLDDAGKIGRQKPTIDVQPLDDLTAVTRAEGVALGVIFHTLTQVNRRLQANLVGEKILLATGTAEDARLVALAMGQSLEQQEWSKSRLLPGQAVVQVQLGYRAPWVGRVQPLVRPLVSDDDVLASQARLRALPVAWADEHPADVLAAVMPRGRAPRQPTDAGEGDLAAWRYLAAVLRYPAKPSSYYAKVAHLNGRRAVAVREAFVARGYLRAHEVAMSLQGRPAILLELTDAGRAALAAAPTEAGA